MNRYTRDEILHNALDMADIATLDVHDRPNGVILPIAYSIKWLQNILDMFHQRYPFASDLEKAIYIIPAAQEDILISPLVTPQQQHEGISPYLPHDFSLDATDGLVCQYSETLFYRPRKLAFQEWLRVQTYYRSQNISQPRVLYYTIIDDKIKVVPNLEESRNAELWYYKLPPLLRAHDRPKYPGDWTLIEYIRLRSLEFARHPAISPGSSEVYAEAELSKDRQAGLLQKAEFDQMPLRGFNYADEGNNLYGWMGTWPTAF